MTPAQLRAGAIGAAMHSLVRGLPVCAERGACRLRAFGSGGLTVTLTEREDVLLLSAWLEGVGRVAAFRLSGDRAGLEAVALDAEALPRWLPVLEFEAAEVEKAGR